jgi:hypothetical protein
MFALRKAYLSKPPIRKAVGLLNGPSLKENSAVQSKTLGEKSRAILEALAEGRACAQMLADDRPLTYWAQTFKRLLHGHVKRSEPVPVNRDRSGKPLKDHDKLVALIRLRDLLYFGVQPTVRQCGLAPDIVQVLAEERLIHLGDKRFGDDLDRYLIEEILPAGVSFIWQQRALRNRLAC